MTKSWVIGGLMALGLGVPALAAPPPGWKPGLKTAIPYTAADIAYGRTLQKKIDTARDASREDAVSKAPMEPFRVVGDLWFVGVHNFGVYLIKTPQGVIMLDTGWGDTEAKLEASLAKIGVKFSDIKYILMTEAHGDHNGAIAIVKPKTNAQLWVMEGDVEAVESGQVTRGPGQLGAVAGGGVKVDKVLHDRDQLVFGGKTLTAYHIPGHTMGSTTWYWQEKENGVTYNVADVCCWFTPDNVVSNPDYSVATLTNNWAVLKSLAVDVPAPGIHTYHFDLLGKLDRKKAGEKFPWLDPEGYRGVIAAFEQDYKDKLAQQRRDGPPPPRRPGQPSPQSAPRPAT